MVLEVIFRFFNLGYLREPKQRKILAILLQYSSTGPTHGEQTQMCLTAMEASTFFYPVPFFVVRDQADRNGDLGHALPHSSLNIPGESAQMHSF